MADILSFFAVVYKDNNAFYGISGQSKPLSCMHENMGTCYLNLVGEEVLLPRNAVPILNAGSDFQHGIVHVPEAGVYQDPTLFADTHYISVVKIKNISTGVVSYCDPTTFNANVINCNPVVNPSICNVVTSLSAGTPAATTATITFTAPSGPVAGYEYINKTSNVVPVIEGTFAVSSPISLTGLTAATTYYFFIKTICGGGSNGRSQWTSFTFTTHA